MGREIDLIGGPLPMIWAVLTGLTLLGALGWPPRWRHLVTVSIFGILAVAALALSAPGSLDMARVPRSFYVWLFLPLFAMGMSLVSWTTAGLGRRIAGLLAVPLTVTFGANQVNAWFAYLPTVADLASSRVEQSVALSQLGEPVVPGAVVRVDIPATTSSFRHRRALVWFPPAAQRTPHDPLPVIMMLAGTPGAPEDLIRAAAFGRVASAYAATHAGVAPILVFPDHNGSFAGDTECVDGPRGNAESYLTVDVPHFMANWLHTPTAGWGIFGYSEGGTCALTLSLRHPELFRAFVDIGGDLRPNVGTGRDAAALRELYGGNEALAAAHDPLSLLLGSRFDGLAGRFVTGSADAPARRSAERLIPAAVAAGIDTSVVRARGHHSFRLVESVGPDAFAWLASHLTTPTKPTPTNQI